jgi:hypothetical protein
VSTTYIKNMAAHGLELIASHGFVPPEEVDAHMVDPWSSPWLDRLTPALGQNSALKRPLERGFPS